tara:strand:+ start:326 stop:640 length:315 start_codon:yes stop_codon:yes gene_type:complete
MEFFDDTKNKQGTKTGIDTQVELVTCFFDHHTGAELAKDFYKSMLVDLYRAITCYRMYNSLEEFMRINPELAECRSDIKELWAEFERLSSAELAEVALELLKDI